MKECILFAYGFDGAGAGHSLEKGEISKKIKDKELAWVHMDANYPETKEWLEREISYLDPFIISALLADETRPRATIIKDGIILILRGVNLNKNSDPEDMVSIRIWIDKHRIISIQKRQLKAVLDIEKKLIEGRGPKDSGEFLSSLILRLSERMEPVIRTMDEATDDVEEAITEVADTKKREDITTIRKRAIILKRYITPQRDAIAKLVTAAEPKWISDLNKRHLQESYNNISRHVEDLDAIRERAQIVKDEIANIMADRLNKNMYFLSVIAAIFLPLGFLTGLFGINVGGMPGAENNSAFYIFSGLLITLVIVQFYVFKKLKWF